MEEILGNNDMISKRFKLLGVDCPSEFVSKWALKEQLTEDDYSKILSLLENVKKQRDDNRRHMLKSMSRLPQVHIKTFDNFDTSRISMMNNDMIAHLKSLSFLDMGETIVIVGDPGTGKTHLAQAIGNLCCERLYSTRYYKMVEIKEKMRKAVEKGKSGSEVENLSNVTCLIIDEVGYCDPLTESESNLFFQILDKRYDKRKGATVFTSNIKTPEWKYLFSNVSVAKCALDRIMDRCIAIDIRGASYRGQHKSVYKVATSAVPEIRGLNL